MERTKIVLEDDSYGEIQLFSGDAQAGELVMSRDGSTVTVYHTEIYAGYEGRGLAKILVAALVSYARENAIKIVPICPYLRAQFERHPDEYVDVWERDAK